MNDFYSDEGLKRLFGIRSTDGMALFEPQELGWICPVCEGSHLAWSEFNDHLWCYDCEKDYFSLLCMKKMNPHTTENILKKETEKMKPLMAEWTLERYKNYREEMKDEIQKKTS